ncbi:hypothetical protein HK414_13180 [Ramlibacter terrae]|uniref:Uncharacterized protein n=1 Tax=Ramlibacter terrae TaxID=2732511 RepID=A0ABX6P2U1_9BURK|nr:hypothetical protein HK414_13180 [Ramlibacter terrae]
MASAQQAEELPPGPTADKLIECASAHTQNIQLLEAAKQDAKPLYPTLGYFKMAGEAYSSKAYAAQKFQESRAALTAKMDSAFAEPEVARRFAIEIFARDLDAQLAECTRFQRANVAAIRARLVSSGLIK